MDIEQKPILIFVQGFGFSGSSAAKDFIVNNTNNPLSLSEPPVLRSLFTLAYSYYKNLNTKPENEKLHLEKILGKFKHKEYKIYTDPSFMLNYLNIKKDVYQVETKQTLLNLKETKNKPEFKMIFTKLLLSIINKNNNKLIILDNVVMPTHNKFLELIDDSLIKTKIVIAGYRQNLLDQFVEQVDCQNRSWKEIWSDKKDIYNSFSMHVRRTLLGKSKVKDITFRMIPKGTNKFLNRYTTKLFYEFFINDLKDRFSIYLKQSNKNNSNAKLYLFNFEKLIDDNPQARVRLIEILEENGVTTTYKESNFSYKDSQKNINKYLNKKNIAQLSKTQITSADNLHPSLQENSIHSV